MEQEQQENNQEEITLGDINQFFYTSDKKIARMDDQFVISKILEKYPDFSENNKESVIKQAFTLFIKDSQHIKYLLDFFNFSIIDLFKVIYRNYSFLFNTCFINRVHDIIKNRCYAKNIRRR